MKPLSTVIDRADAMTLVVVWELRGGYWKVLIFVRLIAAIALVRSSSPKTRLIFPAGIFPNGVWGGIYDENENPTTFKEYQKPQSLFQKRHRLVLELLKVKPGQTKEAIAFNLDVSVATVRQVLRSLEDLGDIHSRPHPMRNNTKLYYTASSAPTNAGKTKNQSSSVRPTPSSPPLKVYFVDPRTLQTLNR